MTYAKSTSVSHLKILSSIAYDPNIEKEQNDDREHRHEPARD